VLQYCSPPLTGQEQAGWAHLLETGLVTVELINSPLGLVLRWSFEIGELLGAVILSASLCRPGVMRTSSGEGFGLHCNAAGSTARYPARAVK